MTEPLELNSLPSNIETAVHIGRQLELQTKTPVNLNGTPFLVIPNDHHIHFYDDRRELPVRIQKTVTLTTADSFLAYYQKFATATTALFLNTATNVFTAIFDYHHPANPNWCEHKAIFELKQTVEWDEWKKHDGSKMTQEEFGHFIEKNLPDIIDPVGAEMLEIALSLQAKTKIAFEKATRLDNGQISFAYREEIDGKAGANGQLKIPEKFTIGLQLFEGRSHYQLDARFRYRITNGNLSIWYELIRPHKTVDANLNDTKFKILEAIKDGQFYEAR